MVRRNLFESIEREINISEEYKKLCRMIAEESYDYFTLHDQIEKHFRDWPNRRNYTSFKELREYLGFNFYCSSVNGKLIFLSSVDSTEGFLLFSELVLNVLDYFYTQFPRTHQATAKHVIETIVANLEILHHKPYKLNNSKIVCIPIDSATISVAEVINDDLVDPILQYHHHLLKGDIERKKAILIRLHNSLEGSRAKIKEFNSDLEDDLFYMFNNMNLRHDNTETGKPHYFNPTFSSLNPQQIEDWYDETYQLCLLAFLALENYNRHNKILNSKRKVI